MVADAYAHVPDGRDVAEQDPHWQELQLRTALPASYLPPSMPTQVHGWRRVAAWTLIVMIVTTTAGGVCLTYGPGDLFALLQVDR